MRCIVVDTEEQADNIVAAIDKARGDTEIVRMPNGVKEERPLRPWTVPVLLKNGKWAVKVDRRVTDHLGLRRTVKGRQVRIPTRVLDVVDVEVDDSEAADIRMNARARKEQREHKQRIVQHRKSRVDDE